MLKFDLKVLTACYCCRLVLLYVITVEKVSKRGLEYTHSLLEMVCHLQLAVPEVLMVRDWRHRQDQAPRELTHLPCVEGRDPHKVEQHGQLGVLDPLDSLLRLLLRHLLLSFRPQFLSCFFNHSLHLFCDGNHHSFLVFTLDFLLLGFERESFELFCLLLLIEEVSV